MQCWRGWREQPRDAPDAPELQKASPCLLFKAIPLYIPSTSHGTLIGRRALSGADEENSFTPDSHHIIPLSFPCTSHGTLIERRALPGATNSNNIVKKKEHEIDSFLETSAWPLLKMIKKSVTGATILKTTSK